MVVHTNVPDASSVLSWDFEQGRYAIVLKKRPPSIRGWYVFNSGVPLLRF